MSGAGQGRRFTFLIAVIRYPTRGDLRGKKALVFVSVYEGAQRTMKAKVQRQEYEAGHTAVSEDRD